MIFICLAAHIHSVSMILEIGFNKFHYKGFIHLMSIFYQFSNILDNQDMLSITERNMEYGNIINHY